MKRKGGREGKKRVQVLKQKQKRGLLVQYAKLYTTIMWQYVITAGIYKNKVCFSSHKETNMKKPSLGPNIGNSGRSSACDGDDDDEASKEAIASYQAREEEIERRKMEVRKRVESQLSRAEEEAKRLTQVWEVSS